MGQTSDQKTPQALHGAAAPFYLPSKANATPLRELRFSWNNRDLKGYEGDSLAAALLANGIRIVGRSSKFHRPRGIFSAGVEEPNALVTLGAGAHAEPTARATMVPLLDGQKVSPQNCWPSVSFDLGRILDFTAPLWPAGFYNKTFIWPSWKAYEPFIRRLAGLGGAPRCADPSRYESCNASCDVLVVGSGPAGLLAAQRAARAGQRVILAEQDFEFGGSLLWDSCQVEGQIGRTWAQCIVHELGTMPNVSLLRGTTVFGLYDHGVAGLLQRLDHFSTEGLLHQRYWRVRARSTVLASGMIEQPWVFENNDLPGIMLAGAIRHYAQRYHVTSGRRIAFATNNDSAYLAALDIARAGVKVPILLDSRAAPPKSLMNAVAAFGVEVRPATIINRVQGNPLVKRIWAKSSNDDQMDEFECDALGVSGGWTPVSHLFSQARGRLRFDSSQQCFIPVPESARVALAGGVIGATSLGATLSSAVETIARELERLGAEAIDRSIPKSEVELTTQAQTDTQRVGGGGWDRRKWVDLQHDVTVSDLTLAIREGFSAVEHMKRYTTTGMSVDQGKTSNLNALLVAARLMGKEPAVVGTTTYRPPYTPVTLGAIAGSQTGPFYLPRRLLPAHEEHLALGANMKEFGGWTRPECYPRPAESHAAAIRREAHAVRTAVGLSDSSPLGKIEVLGPDATQFLDRFYINNMATLAPGQVRYGIMLNEAGVVIDDGTVGRLAENHYFVTTTSSGATRICAWLEEWRQCEWPNLEVAVVPVTTTWTTYAIAGPLARAVLSQLPGSIGLDPSSFPHLRVRAGTLCDVSACIARVSFSGEVGFEVSVPARFGRSLWTKLLEVGKPFGITPYGVEAALLLRTEKGYLHVGVDTDGTTVPADIGWGETAMRKQADFIGRRSLRLPAHLRSDRRQLVGLCDFSDLAAAPGAHLRLRGTTEGSDGWITSVAQSPALCTTVALGLLTAGRARHGERVTVFDDGKQSTATVCAPVFYDLKNERLND